MQSYLSIGNDIVDLSIDTSVHRRYRERVLTPCEKDYIGDDLKLLWLFWSAKEAAYKALKRLNPEIYFSPINLCYNPESKLIKFCENLNSSKKYFSDELIIKSVSTITETLIHTTAYIGFKKAPITLIVEDLSLPYSELAKLLVSQVGDPLECRINLEKDRNNIPTLILNDSYLPFSISHHGRYLAAAAPL
jgi:phosphopantetheinyl transferase (holo-ACP synthase)